MNRDPLTNILAFLAVIVFVAIIGYLLGRAKRSNKQKILEKFLNGFAIADGQDFKEIGAFAAMSQSFIEPLCILAKGYAHSGEFEKAIALLQSVLNHMPKSNKTKEVEVLQSLADIYTEAGMLMRASETILSLLKIDSRNIDALNKLVILREKQGEYEKALDVLDVLEELGRVDNGSREYIKGLLDLKNEKKPTVQSRYFDRIELQNAIFSNESIDGLKAVSDYKTSLDLLWYYNKPLNSIVFENINSAKNGQDVNDGAPFALKLLSKASNIKADLRFSYKCEICGHEDAMFFGRCPKCQNANSCFVDASVVQKTNIESAMFT